MDFTRPLYGSGREAVAASAIRALGETLLLVGATSEPHPLGRWTSIRAEERTCRFLPVIRSAALWQRSRLPANVRFMLAVARHGRSLREPAVPNALTGTYTVLWWLALTWRGCQICFYFPGLANPLLVGRRPRQGRFLAALYEPVHALALRRTAAAFAAASPAAVEQYNRALRRRAPAVRVQPLPTAVNTRFFSPAPAELPRRKLGVQPSAFVLTFVGRLAAVKGVPFLLDALRHLRHERSDAVLLLAGDGEERRPLEQAVSNMGLARHVRFLGSLPPDGVRDAILAADVCVVGSHAEGFSCAMLEELACGRPVVSTDVSGARELIRDGENGFVVAERDSALFARRVLDAALLPEAGRLAREAVARAYSDQAVWTRAAACWPPLGPVASSP